MIYIIAAISKNKQIGLNGQMPWHIPEDLTYFREITTGHPVIMGRKTYESIGRLLLNRHNIILTHSRSFKPFPSTSPSTKVDVVYSIDEALALIPNSIPSFVIGGGEIYRAFLPYCTRLYLTLIDQCTEGDTVFPEFESTFKCIHSVPGKTTTADGHHFCFTIWERN